MVNFCRRTAVHAACILLTTTAALAQDEAYSFALFGDMPYTSSALPDAVQRYQRLIAHMNTFDVKFGIHVGDIKAGSTRCDDAVYANNLTLFNTFKAPIIYTPGDNEWTDCHRLNNGNYAPLDRLALLRSTFYSTNTSLGQKQVELTRQPGYPENVRYYRARTLVIAIHMPGSNNNRQQIISEMIPATSVTPAIPRLNPYYDGDAEYTARNAANLAWLEEGMNMAINDPSVKAVVVAFQANPFERFLEGTSSSNNNPYDFSGFSDFVTKLREKTLLLRNKGKAVLAAHGDTHIMRIGKVLTDTYPGCDPAVPLKCVAVPFGGDVIDNFTRAEVFAQNNVHWIKVTVEPDSPGVFSFQPMLVPGN
jgi:hypothetical protein